MSDNAMIVLITASVLTFFVMILYIVSRSAVKELEAKVKVLDAMTRTIKAAEEKGFSEKFKKGLADYVCDEEKGKK